jgi:hypothetical protein
MPVRESKRAFGRAVFFDEQGKKIPGKRHVNPDGSEGGFVAENVRVPESAYIHPTALILPGAEVEPFANVGSGQIIDCGPR